MNITTDTKPEEIAIPLEDGWVACLSINYMGESSEIDWMVSKNGRESGYGKTIAEAMQNAKERNR